MLEEDLLTVEQTAKRLGTAERFVRSLVSQRRIRFYRVGKYVRFDPADVRDFIRNGEVPPVQIRTVYRRGVRACA